MSHDTDRTPLLETFYQQYLNDECSASFIRSVSQRYGLGTLERLARYGHRISRRAATLAIGFLGDFRFNETVGRALSDSDRAVRILADHGIRQIWTRDGSTSDQYLLRQVMQLNNRYRLEEAIDVADELIERNPTFAEAWNQRAIAKYGMERFEEAIEDCRETMYLNRFQFGASLGIANCYLILDEGPFALEFFRVALSINPDLESVRGQILQLERTLDN